MKTWIKAILGLIIIVFLAFATYIGILIFSLSKDDIDNSVEYYTKEELSELCWQNKTVLNSVKDSVLSSKSLLRALDEYGEGDYEISYQGDKKYFTEEEWANIVSVFKTFHPIMLMLERKGRPLIFYMPFGSLKQDDVVKRTFLYWFPNEEEREYHEKPGIFPDGVFTQLDEGWYIVETTESR